MKVEDRELSDDALRHQIDAFMARAARTVDPDFEGWLETKDFSAGDRTVLREMYRQAAYRERSSA